MFSTFLLFNFDKEQLQPTFPVSCARVRGTQGKMSAQVSSKMSAHTKKT